MKKLLHSIGKKSKKAFSCQINSKMKDKVLKDYFLLIKKNKRLIINENKKDLRNAFKKGVKHNFINRLILDEKKILGIINSIKKIIKLKDPTRIVLEKWKRPNGLKISKVSIPIGVIGIIYESRPNVTSDVAALCFKSGNAVILKGGTLNLNDISQAVIYKGGIFRSLSSSPVGAIDSNAVLNDLTDVAVQTPADNDFLTYNATTSQWVNISRDLLFGGEDADRKEALFNVVGLSDIYYTTKL